MNKNLVKNIGIIIPYSFFPPTNGGALRCFYVVKEISKCHNLVLFISEQENMPEFLDWIESLKNVRYVIILSSKNKTRNLLNKFKDRLRSGIHTNRFFQPTNQVFLDGFELIRNEINNQKFDAFICENLDTLICFNKLLKKYQIPVVYEAHNVDSDLWLQMHLKTGNKQYLYNSKAALLTEKKLGNIADLVVTVTNNDKIRLSNLSTTSSVNIEVVESGVDTDLKIPAHQKNDDRFNILFCGTLEYEPNYEGLVWFYYNVLPLFKKLGILFKITVIGKLTNSERYNFLKDSNDVNFIGTVESVNKYYNEADVSIVPILSGSGIRLKITESLSFAVPVVSTTLGAEGIRENNAVLLADTPEEFVDSLIRLYQLGELRRELGNKGREMVLKYYDWKSLMSKFNENILKIINTHTN